MQNHVQRRAGMAGWIHSTIGRKQLIGLTGLGLSLFVLTHMAANMLIIISAQAYNEYSHALVSNPFVYVAEAGLVAMFLAHLVLALRLSWQNFRARDTRYAVLPNGAKRTSWTQRSLWAQGILIFVFLVLHLITFKFGTHYTVDYGKGEIRDLHRLVIEVFNEPAYVAWYLVALVVLFFHLWHGVGSSFQTLGFHHPRYQGAIRILSTVYAIIVIGGFISQPVYVFFLRG